LAVSIIVFLSRFLEFQPISVKRSCNVDTTIVTSFAAVEGNTTRTNTCADDSMVMVALGDGNLRTNFVYLYLYNTALYCLLHLGVLKMNILVLVLVFNVRLVNRLTQCRRVVWHVLSSAPMLNVRELRASRLPLVIVLVLTVCSTISFS
jgi:hypothetical protein